MILVILCVFFFKLKRAQKKQNDPSGITEDQFKRLTLNDSSSINTTTTTTSETSSLSLSAAINTSHQVILPPQHNQNAAAALSPESVNISLVSEKDQHPAFPKSQLQQQQSFLNGSSRDPFNESATSQQNLMLSQNMSLPRSGGGGGDNDVSTLGNNQQPNEGPLEDDENEDS